MAILRLMVVFVSASLLSGCYLWGDFNSLKADLRSLKAVLRSTPLPTGCQLPGTPQPRVCYYVLHVEPFDKTKHMFKGHVPKRVVEEAYKACLRARDEYLSRHSTARNDFVCRDPASYSYAWYGFVIDGDDVKADYRGELQLVNIPGTNHMRRGRPEEAEVYLLTAEQSQAQ